MYLHLCLINNWLANIRQLQTLQQRYRITGERHNNSNDEAVMLLTSNVYRYCQECHRNVKPLLPLQVMLQRLQPTDSTSLHYRNERRLQNADRQLARSTRPLQRCVTFPAYTEHDIG